MNPCRRSWCPCCTAAFSITELGTRRARSASSSCSRNAGTPWPLSTRSPGGINRVATFARHRRMISPRWVAMKSWSIEHFRFPASYAKAEQRRCAEPHTCWLLTRRGRSAEGAPFERPRRSSSPRLNHGRAGVPGGTYATPGLGACAWKPRIRRRACGTARSGSGQGSTLASQDE